MNDRSRHVAEVTIIAITIIVIVVIFSLFLYRSNLLDKNGVYVIGKVTSIKNVENGYNATIAYSFNKKRYFTVQKTFPAIKDGFVFLLISKDRPKICSLITTSKVPLCLVRGRYFDSSWNSIPACQ